MRSRLDFGGETCIKSDHLEIFFLDIDAYFQGH